MGHNRIRAVLLAIILTAVFALIYVGLEVKSVQLGYKLKHKERALDTLRDENQTLKVNLTALESPVYLEKALASNSGADITPADFKVVRIKAKY